MSTRVHGMLDYIVGALLIVAPFLLQFDRGGAETWIPVILGAGVILYSLLTDNENSLVRLIPMPLHLGLDAVGGAFLALSPWIFGFNDLVWWPHVLIGVAEIGVALITQTRPTGARTHLPGQPRPV